MQALPEPASFLQSLHLSGCLGRPGLVLFMCCQPCTELGIGFNLFRFTNRPRQKLNLFFFLKYPVIFLTVCDLVVCFVSYEYFQITALFHFQRLDASLKKATPWLVLAGSGPAADLISELLDSFPSVPLSPTSPPAEGEAAEALSTEFRDRVRDKVRRHFPAEADPEKLVDSVSQIAHV